METALSYSLQDFLLFSRETWSVLYAEYAQQVFFAPFIVLFLYGVTLVSGYIRPALAKPLNLVTQLLILCSCCGYYWLFYADINPFSEILTGICVFLLLVVVAKIAWLSKQQQTHIFIENGRAGQFQKFIWLWLLPGISLLVFMERVESEFDDWLLPGWYAGTSLLLLINLQLLNNNRWRLLFSVLLIITESLTLYLIEVTLWWLPLLLVTAMLGALTLDLLKERKQQIHDEF